MRPLSALALTLALTLPAAADPVPVVSDVEGQPVAANAERLTKALDMLGAPLPADTTAALKDAVMKQDAKAVQAALDPRVLFVVNINPESRVKVARGPAEPTLQQSGFVPVLVKVVNESTVKKPLGVTSPQAGPRYSGPGRNEKDPKADPAAKDRFLQAEVFTAPPMTRELSGLKVEYTIVLLFSSEAGKREATIGFDVGQGNQDLGFRGETAVLFDVKPAIPVKLKIADFDGKPTTGRFTFTDALGKVYPPQPKRLAPDFFFQQQIYRHDGGTVLLPPGEFTVVYGRGPEYRLLSRKLQVTPDLKMFGVKLDRWVNPADHGWYSGDHHIHSAGCAHYTSPTEGVMPEDMFLHVKGEGLNVGCCLTWGPCYDFQRQYFEAMPHKLSEPFTVIKYDVEVSGFGSQALGHVCLLNLRDQTYPGSAGTKTKGWPTWTTPLMQWAKEQGAVTGYAHSANGLTLDGQQAGVAARGLVASLDADKNGTVSAAEAGKGLLPEDFAAIDGNGDDGLTADEIATSMGRVKNKLPNNAIPPMNGIGAQEICVTSAMGVCDFISAMDTQRVPEWNCWYHIMNCGFPLKVSGETDFPCVSGGRVGQGRVYVQLGKVELVDFAAWCKGIQQGKSYVSDGYAHALKFTVDGVAPGFGDVKKDAAGNVEVKATVAFAKDVALGTAIGGPTPRGNTRTVELIVNGQVAATKEVPADDQPHDITFTVPVAKSSWVALRHFPQLHTNPVNVLVAGKPIRASKDSAKWCLGVIEQLWRVRAKDIIPAERGAAEKTFQKATEMYKQILAEAD